MKDIGGSHRANLFVPNTSPRYREMVDRSLDRMTDPKDFMFGRSITADEVGIWVPVTWWYERPFTFTEGAA